ncbi:PepSY domain-containing protein [Priestia taiwanensis]|uniref:PepSY domain-containing protein n=1 Tax=Priestia taiwanensis TaxID=1347902 RepID=A0A917AN01_9BACI|nr:PepSY domain-containing protein [Priestia taiwanensis]MBM7362493.1 putative membrane protein YkoI [Priestia taiwanensis]GGE62658.1 hypothetical protein GCM10007140_11170 [Priestia taiwanensis]
MQKKKYRMFFLITCCSIFIWSGCQDNQSINNSTKPLEAEGNTAVNETVKMMTKEEIVKEIEEKYKGKVTDIEVETTSTYEVDLIVGSEKRKLIVNGSTGKVMSDKTDGQVVTPQVPPKALTITKEKTEEIALQQSGGGYVLKTELDLDNNMNTYEVKVVKGNIKYEYEIDTTTGNIVQSKQE